MEYTILHYSISILLFLIILSGIFMIAYKLSVKDLLFLVKTKKQERTMAKILKFQETNVIDFCAYKKNKEKQGMTEKEFNEKYMKDSLVSKHGPKIMEVFNSNKKK